MKECVVDGLKADCGQFRPETFEKLPLKILEAFPTCTLTAKHCKNKYKRLKETYQYASEMLTCNGIFGKDRAMGAGAVSGFDAQEQVQEEEENHSPSLDDFGM
ncbi:hypothetical protein HN51_032023 [Arachis hypogaea]